MTIINIKNNSQVTEEYFLMELDAPNLVDKTEPGQFFNLRFNNGRSYDPLLRRPLSVHDLNKKTGSILLLYRLVGRGTELLSKYKAGESLDILGPLGSGFDVSLEKKKILIIGGGMGIAPLYYLTKKLLADTGKSGNHLTILLGGNSKEDLGYFAERFEGIKTGIDASLETDIRYTTIDGSLGEMGNVIELWEKLFRFDYDYLYTCGPVPMLVHVQELAGRYNIDGQVSLEERMGCGIGLCLSCVCKTDKGNQRICKEGPIFPLQSVNFNIESGCDCNE
ncbi:MAG: dihydroorotate dehydrogenase electron transfer subunit [Halanaerobiales bacterium]